MADREGLLETSSPRRELTWFDSTSIIVGTIIGAGIYQTAPEVAGAVSTPWMLFGLWLVGGLISLCGAMCYAELASMYPRTGGDYIYLKQAYGDWAGFLFGWMQMLVIRPGDIAIIAFGFATYFNALLPRQVPHGESTTFYAASAVVFLTLINIVGVRQSKWMQNLLTTLKVIGLLGIVLVAFGSNIPTSNMPTGNVTPTQGVPSQGLPISVALILVLFTYGGWNEMAYVAAEVKHPERNMVRSLVGGTLIVSLLYLLINGAFLRVLGLEGMRESSAVATDTVEALLPSMGGKLVSLLICISTLGTVNGMILTGSRISYALGTDHHIFRGLGRWDPRTGTPIVALVFQGLMTLILILILRSFTSAVLYTSAAVYTFYFATSMAVVVLRMRQPGLQRPYRVTGFPIPTIVFAVTCLFLMNGAVRYNPTMAYFVVGLAVVGLIVFAVFKTEHNEA